MKRLLFLSDPIIAPSYNPRVRYMKQYLLRQGYSFEPPYDAVLCSTFALKPIPEAYRYAKRLHIPLIIDIRDLLEQVPHSLYMHRHQEWYLRPLMYAKRWLTKRIRNYYLKRADVLTTVSPWHVDFLKRFNPNVHLIYNGYDPTLFYPQDIRAEAFTILYVGRLFDFQEPSLVLLEQALTELNNPAIQLRLIHQGVQPEDVPALLHQASIVLTLTSKKAYGMMTTKFYEALGCEKPVLCIPDDEGCLAQTIRETNAGLACDDKETIKQFILARYEEWKQKGYTRQAVKGKAFFSREEQMKRMEDVLP